MRYSRIRHLFPRHHPRQPRSLRHELRDEPRNNHLADLCRGLRTSAPLLDHIVLLATANLLRRTGADVRTIKMALVAGTG